MRQKEGCVQEQIYTRISLFCIESNLTGYWIFLYLQIDEKEKKLSKEKKKRTKRNEERKLIHA